MDLLSAESLDSSALGVFINIARKLRAKDGMLKLVVGDDQRQVFELTGVGSILSLHLTLDDATNTPPGGSRTLVHDELE